MAAGQYYPVVGVGVYLVSFAVAYLFGCILEKIILSTAPTLKRIDNGGSTRSTVTIDKS